MVEKKEGNQMTCQNCRTVLTCRSKTYAASDKFPEKTVLQWQNEDGSAHYSTKNGKDFTCNVPEGQAPHPTGDDSQTTLHQSSTGVPPNESLDAKIDRLAAKMATYQEMLQSILHIVTDLKTEGVYIREVE